MTDFVLNVFGGLVTGAIYSFLGTWASSEKEGFNINKFGSSLLVGVVAGSLYGASGISFSESAIDAWVAMLPTFGLTATLQKLVKGIGFRLGKK